MGDGAQQGALAGAGRALQQHMAAGGERGHHQFHLAGAAHHPAQHALYQGGGVGHLRSVGRQWS